MPKDRIAEWLLVLVTTRERAASIVGDMMESSAAYGRVWWWSAVLRAAASLLWGGFAGSPLGMLVLGLLACLMGLLLMLISIFVPFFLLKIFGITELPFDMAVWSTGFFAAFCLCQFLVGCWIARRAPGRALSAWLAMLIMDQFLNVLPWIVRLVLGYPFSQDWAWQPPNWHSGLVYLSCLAGTIWVRERAVT